MEGVGGELYTHHHLVKAMGHPGLRYALPCQDPDSGPVMKSRPSSTAGEPSSPPSLPFSTPSSSRGNTGGVLLDLLHWDLEPGGHRLILPYLTVPDQLRLSECCKSLMSYRTYLPCIKIIQHPSPTIEVERGLVQLLVKQVAMSSICVGHESALRLVLEAVRSGGCRGLKSLDMAEIRAKGSDAELVGAVLAEGAGRGLEELILGLRWDSPSAAGVGDVLSALAQGACPGLRRLELQSTSFYVHRGGEQIATALESGHCHSLRELYLHGIQIGDNGCSSMAKAIQSGSCSGLLALNLSDCAIRSTGGVSLGQALRTGSCPKLEMLSLSINYLLGDEGISHVVQGLAAGGCPMLKRLDLDRICMGPSGGRSLARALDSGAFSHLEHLDLSYNLRLGDGALAAILRAMGLTGTCPNIQYLNLHKTGMGRAACLALIECLEAPAWPKLQHVDITRMDNGTDHHVNHIITLLASGDYVDLQSLHLSFNGSTAGEQALVEAVGNQAWPKLEVLKVWCQNPFLGDKMGMGLGEALCRSGGGRLKVLGLEGLCEGGANRLAEVMKKGVCPMLEEMHVNYVGGIDWRGAVARREKEVKITIL